MSSSNILTLVLGLILFSFFTTSVFTVPFIDILYKFKFQRRKEALAKAKDKSLFDKLHDKKAGTPIGGGILVIVLVTVLFLLVVPFARRMGIYIQTSFDPRNELIIMIFTFISFGILGFLDDYIKIFGKPKPGKLGAVFGLTKMQKFALQWILGFGIAWFLYAKLGIQIVHIPLFDFVLNLSFFYIPFAAFIVVFFSNAFNITDGLDGLSSGLLMIYIFAYIIIAAGNLDTPIFIFLSIWLGSLMSFLYFNVPPARIFMGDAGALSFGAMIALIGLLTGNVATLFVIGAIFVIELLSSLIQIVGWKVLKRKILPLAPLHHTLEAIGWEEPKIVMRAWLVGVMLAIFGLWLATI